jgi:hypothetical protein
VTAHPSAEWMARKLTEAFLLICSRRGIKPIRGNCGL